ncbi:hypothetical protein EVAR_70617_1 [Eumeta japonica]|uniref:Uncharacterized protein n=1 Tax=Eumeta variegata TaxID=151549 RepID=A0A4C2AAT1_EUMVA|nr:hypothetical protein EVAR_70617_1 [Eumeta japonica]
MDNNHPHALDLLQPGSDLGNCYITVETYLQTSELGTAVRRRRARYPCTSSQMTVKSTRSLWQMRSGFVVAFVMLLTSRHAAYYVTIAPAGGGAESAVSRPCWYVALRFVTAKVVALYMRIGRVSEAN